MKIICAEVDKRDHKKWSYRLSGSKSSGGIRSLPEMRIGRNHLLVQDAHYADSIRLGSIEHDIFSYLKPM